MADIVWCRYKKSRIDGTSQATQFCSISNYSGNIVIYYLSFRRSIAVSLYWDSRCFSGEIVFIDVLGILDAALSRFLN